MPWNPEIAPQAIVTNSSGTMLGVPSGTAVLMAGATISGFVAENRVAVSTEPKRRMSPMNSCTPLM